MQLPREIDRWPEVWRELYEERAGILEYMGNFPKLYAEAEAENDIRRQAMKEQKREVFQ